MSDALTLQAFSRTSHHLPRSKFLKLWAQQTARLPDDAPIEWPRGVDRESAEIALELAIFERIRAPAPEPVLPLVQLGQGRTPSDHAGVFAQGIVVILAGLALLALALAFA